MFKKLAALCLVIFIGLWAGISCAESSLVASNNRLFYDLTQQGFSKYVNGQKYRVAEPNRSLRGDGDNFYLLFTDPATGTINSYLQTADNGLLKPAKSMASGQGASSIAVAARNNWIYVANKLDHNILLFSLNFTDGSFKPLMTIPLGQSVIPAKMIINFQETFLYILDSNSHEIVEYAITQNGSLKLIGKVSTGDSPTDLMFDPTNQWVFVTNTDDKSISIYRVDMSMGTLSLSSTVQTEEPPVDITFDATGQYAYVTTQYPDTQKDQVFAYRWSNETLTSIDGAIAGMDPQALSLDPVTNTLYVADSGNSQLSEYKFTGPGQLKLVGSTQTGQQPSILMLAPPLDNIRYLYVADADSQAISIYRENLDTGALTFLTQTNIGSNPADMTMIGEVIKR